MKSTSRNNPNSFPILITAHFLFEEILNLNLAFAVCRKRHSKSLISEMFLSDTRQLEEGPFPFYNALAPPFVIAKCLYSYRDDLPENLGETTSQECKRLQLTIVGRPGGGGVTWVFLGWVCAARDSKLAPRSKKTFSSKLIPRSRNGPIFYTPF